MERFSRTHKKCVICNKRRIPGSNLHMFKLPLDPIRCQQWVKAIGQEDLVYLPIEKLHQLKIVCSEHFSQEDFNKTSTRLSSDAVPKLNLNSKPLEDSLFNDFPLHIGQYSKQSVLQDIGNLDSERSKTQLEESLSTTWNCNVLDSFEEPGPSHVNIQSHKIMKSNPEAKDSLEEPGPSQVYVKSYKRKIRSAEGLNAREEKLLEKLKNQRVTLRKLARTRLDLEKLDSTILKNLVTDVAQNSKKKTTGKRWSLKTKLWALAIFKRSPKAYRYLEWAISLPSSKTLQRLLQNVPLEPGISKTFISKYCNMISELSDKDKFCALLFDEMALKKRLIYNEGSDKIEGFEDNGDERSSKIADHALVFMVQGLHRKFKLPVAFFFVQGTISSAKLSTIIKSVITLLEEVGFKILTTVCDQGPTNIGALNLLKKFGGQCTEDNYFIFNNEKKVFIMFDIPHLFKSIRNNFFNAGEMIWGEKNAKWSYLVEAEELNRQFLNFNKLNKNLVNPTYKSKMRVKYAANTLSNTMSAILTMLSWKHDKDAKNVTETAEIIKDLDRLFDICNGPSSPKDVKKGIRENVSHSSNHVEMWQYYLNKIESIKFLKSSSQLQLKHVRCIKGFKISLKSLLDIWSFLQKQGFKYLNLRQLNQDSLENLFGLIRQHSVTNKNPTCAHFIAALKTSILCGLTAPHSRGSNCEPDSSRFFFNYNNINFNEESDELNSPGTSLDGSVVVNINTDVPVLTLPDEVEEFHLEKLYSFENQPVVYVSGYIASRMLKGSNCNECKESFSNENPNDNNNDLYNFISLREWWTDKKSLTYPSIGLCQTIEKAKNIFQNHENYHMLNISIFYVLELSVGCDLNWFMCSVHLEKKNILLKKLSILFIRKYCKLCNENFASTEYEKINTK